MSKPSIGIFMTLIAVFITSPHSQTPPQAISYQALVRDGAGTVVRNRAVGVRIRLHQDSAAAPIAYSETFTPTTNGFGNINLSIGRGTGVSGTFSTLDWSRPMYVEIGVDTTGGTTYVDLGITQLLSVPYALYAGRSATVTSVNLSEIHDADGNTRVSTERNPNEDIIRFDIGGSEKMRLIGNRLEFANILGNSIYIGDSAGAGSTGFGNLFVGYKAGRLNTTGGDNTFSGASAGSSNTTGGNNTFSGSSAGFSNTTGSYNAFFGKQVGTFNTTGNYNSFSGSTAGSSNTTGSFNTYSGAYAGSINTTGSYNTFSGYGAGSQNTTGLGNVYVGYSAGPAFNDTNKLYINNALGVPLIWGNFAADSVRINGGMSVARSITATAFNVSSDRRLKENIRPVANALEGVGKINGVYFNYKTKAPDGNSYPQSRQIGVIAQDVENVYPELVAVQPGGYKAVDYPKLTAVLIEAVKEQQRQKVELEKKLEGKIQEMSARLERVETALRLSLAAKDGAKVAGR